MSALVPEATSLVTAVGDEVIDRTPAGLREQAIESVGQRDKPLLVMGVLLVPVLLGALLASPRGARGLQLFVGGAAVLSLIGGAAAMHSPGASTAGAAVTASTGFAAAVGAVFYLRSLPLVRALGADERRPARDPSPPRRWLVTRFLALSVATAVGAAGAHVLTQGAQRSSEAQRGRVRLRPVSQPLPPVPEAANILGLGPVITPTGEFYRIDTALRLPTPPLDAWRLRVTGLVDQPLSLTYAELNELPQIEADVTLTCVGNQVGGDLVGTARWQGVALQTVLDRARVHGAADQLVGRSTDDFTAGFPVALARDGRPALIALGMNGQPLPFEHGFPARLVVSGLYGYCSATKWLTEIELTRFDSFTAYWRRRGWSEPTPISTQSRIDIPRSEASLQSGPVQVGGVAWAQHRGIRAVEVAVNEGPWMRAALAQELSIDSWRLWTYAWTATPGRHVLRVRATDGSGTLQPQGERQPFPSGASGWHTIAVTVR